jgi:hypothetical protein
MENSSSFQVFKQCTHAVMKGTLIRRASKSDKEYHFQNWFEARLKEAKFQFDSPGRNTYPDFRLVHQPEGFEIKGLAWPGRESTYDCNSRVPSGMHNGRAIFYVFGRYPNAADAGKEYPVIDLVVCHGDFLNADHEYIHKNRSIKGFGSMVI